MKARTTGVVTAVAMCAAAVLLFFFGRHSAIEAVYPVERARVFCRRVVWSRLGGMCRGAAAQAENVRLRREVSALAMMQGDVERLEAENARLRVALDYARKAPGRWLAASVLSEQGGAASAGETLRVDQGSLAGVQVGAIVAVPEGLVGRVTDVTPHTAEITLITTESVQVACEAESTGGTLPLRGILTGDSADLLILRYLSGSTDVSPRARVVTSGLGGVFPKGLAVGTLHDVVRDAQGVVRTVRVDPAVDYHYLEDVFIRCEK